MPEENLTGGEWSSQKSSLGTGEGESPLAPQNLPKIDLRTMASDQKTINQANTNEPRPYIPPPSVPPRPTETPKIDDRSFSEVIEKNVINPPSISSIPIPPPPIPTDLTKIKQKKRSSFGLIIVLILIVGAIALGYFVVYPYFKTPILTTPPPLNAVCGNNACENDETEQSCPADCTKTPLPVTPVCGNAICETDEDAQNCPADCPSTPPLDQINTSLFKISPDAIINEGDPLPTNLPVGSIVKIQVSSFAKLSESFPESLKNVFSNTEYDSFIFIGKNNTSAGGSILKIEKQENLSSVQQSWTEAVESPQFYMTVLLSGLGAGEPKTWKSGQTDGVINRYLTFENPGFALNYGWLNDKLIISTSYESFKEVLRRLQ